MRKTGIAPIKSKGIAERTHDQARLMYGAVIAALWTKRGKTTEGRPGGWWLTALPPKMRSR
jgi:hypothetical protein